MRKGFLLVLLSAFLLACAVPSLAAVASGDSFVRIGEDIHVPYGRSVKNVVAVRGNVYVRGVIEEDVVAVMGDVRLYSTARVGEDAVTVGGRVIKDPNAIVGGDVVDVTMNRHVAGVMKAAEPYIGVMSIFGVAVFVIIILLGLLGLVAVLVSFMQKHLGVIAAKVRQSWWKSLLWGLLGVALLVPAVISLALSVIGIPLIFIVLVFISAAMLLGYVAVAQILGNRLLDMHYKKAKKKPSVLIEAILGVAVLFLVGLIPYVGGLVRNIALLTGFGAAITTKLGFEKKGK